MRVIDDASDPWAEDPRVEINITPPRDLVDAMARQMKADVKSVQTFLSEGFRAAEILKSEVKSSR